MDRSLATSPKSLRTIILPSVRMYILYMCVCIYRHIQYRNKLWKYYIYKQS
uniref:Uncharacterized protein n=2 Tax=Anguilla anguilla TaxID=7936 RepID=A0A0E9SER6_ANGAN